MSLLAGSGAGCYVLSVRYLPRAPAPCMQSCVFVHPIVMQSCVTCHC